MKWLLRIAGLGLLIALGWWVWQHVFVTDEQRVRHLLASLTRAVETGNLLKLEAGIAHDYTDEFGLDKSTVIGAVRSFRAPYDGVLILLSDLKITVAADHQQAEAVFIAKILAKPKGALTNSELRADRFRLRFRKTDQGWQLTHTESPQLKFE